MRSVASSRSVLPHRLDVDTPPVTKRAGTTGAAAEPQVRSGIASPRPPKLEDVITPGLPNPLVGVWAGCARSVAGVVLALSVGAGCGDQAFQAGGAVSPDAEAATQKASNRPKPYRPLITQAMIRAELRTMPPDGTPVVYKPLELSSFDYEALVSLIEANDVRRIEDLLPLLPKPLLSSYTMMRDSDSLHSDASLAEPRVILYGTDASLVLAYAGSAQQAHGNDLEVMQYRRDSRSFELRNIAFSATGEPPVPSQANPPGCLSCHQQDPRPNWDTYPFWPGAVAGYDDELAPDEKNLSISLAALQATNARYRPLVDLAIGYERHEDTRTNKTHNIDFTGHLASLNHHRLTRLMQATPEFDKYKYATLGAVMCGAQDNLAAWLPADVARRHRAAHVQNPLPQTVIRMGEQVEPERTFDSLFDWRGISTNAWSMPFDNRHDFQTPGGEQQELAYVLGFFEPDLRRFLQADLPPRRGVDYTNHSARLLHTPQEPRGVCESLRKASLAAFEK